MTLYLILLAVIVLMMVFLAFVTFSMVMSEFYGAPYVPIERKNLRKIFEMGGLRADDVICDFGSGDGRVLFDAVKTFGVTSGVGYEISFWPYFKSVLSSKIGNFGGKVKFYRKNFLEESGDNLGGITFAYAYIYPSLVKKASLGVFSKLKNGTKLAVISFAIPSDNRNFRIVKVGMVGWHRVFIYEKVG